MRTTFFLSTILWGVTSAQNGSALPWWDMTPYEVRETLNQRIMAIEAPTPLVSAVVDRLVAGDTSSTPIRIYTPMKGDNFPIILLIHGGAWVAGNLDTHDNLARFLCAETEALVVSVGYLNAPEGKFPLPLQQCFEVLTWIANHAAEYAADGSKIAVVGDSAGGNIAATLCLMARDRCGPKIALQVLINPAPDLTCNGTLERQNDRLDTLRWPALQYLSQPTEATNPYASPLHAADLSHLPAALVLLAEKDELREMGQKYADRLLAAEVPTFVYCQQGIGHLAGHAARASISARESLDVAVVALRKVLKVS